MAKSTNKNALRYVEKRDRELVALARLILRLIGSTSNILQQKSSRNTSHAYKYWLSTTTYCLRRKLTLIHKDGSLRFDEESTRDCFVAHLGAGGLWFTNWPTCCCSTPDGPLETVKCLKQ
jgi:hypothetical protein